MNSTSTSAHEHESTREDDKVSYTIYHIWISQEHIRANLFSACNLHSFFLVTELLLVPGPW
jgi:hypothetical protein